MNLRDEIAKQIAKSMINNKKIRDLFIPVENKELGNKLAKAIHHESYEMADEIIKSMSEKNGRKNKRIC